jgi:FAS-associated factor 2
MFRGTVRNLTGILAWLWALIRTCFGSPLQHVYHPLRQTPLEISESRRFQTRFEDEYGTIHPKFFNGDFKDAIERAKRDYRILLIYLHSPSHINTPRFCNDVLCQEGFKEYVDENFLFYAADISNKDGYTLSNQLRATTYPFLAVGLVTQGKFAPIAKIEGVTDMNALIAQLVGLHEDAEPQLIASRIEDQERASIRTQREEQDRAYQLSLERDRQLELERQRKREQELERQRQLEEKKRLKEEKLKRIAEERQTIARQFPSEPAQSKDTATIRFRFPDGSQSERRFNKKDYNKLLFEYVHALAVMKPKGVTWEPRSNSELTNYELTTNFPKKSLEMNKTLEESGCANAVILVRENDEDDEQSTEEIVEITE